MATRLTMIAIEDDSPVLRLLLLLSPNLVFLSLFYCC